MCLWVLLSVPFQAFSVESHLFGQSLHTRQASLDATAQRILDDAGVLPQLIGALDTILEESREQWLNCNTPSEAIEYWLAEAMSAEWMIRHSVDSFRDALDEKTLAAVIAWQDSSAGQAIIKAERASANLSDEQFGRLVSEISAAPGYLEKRGPRIQDLLVATRTAEFVTVLNSELNTLVSLSTECSPSVDTIQEIMDKANAERRDPDLLVLIMGFNLQMPTAVVFRDIDDAVIDAYLEFSKSSAGRTYHAALIELTRNALIKSIKSFAHWRLMHD